MNDNNDFILNKHIAIVDDDSKIRVLLARLLRNQGFIVSVADSAKEIMHMLDYLIMDLLIIDVMMPKVNGIELSNKIRAVSVVPIILLTALNNSDDKIKGLQSQVDDYITKPFNPEELILRIKNILWRNSHQYQITYDNHIVKLGDISYNPKTRRLYDGNVDIPITDCEADLLNIFTSKANEVVSRSTLSKLCDIPNERSIDVKITRLRAKIKENTSNPYYLRTVRNKGYMLRVD